MEVLAGQLLKIIWIVLIAGTIGLEREKRHVAAGLRTHMLVGLGSTLLTLVALDGVYEYARIIASIVSGIGFIGAGAIIAQGRGTIHGLTTATNLWVVSGLGICVGLGYYLLSALVAGLVLFILYLGKFEHHSE